MNDKPDEVMLYGNSSDMIKDIDISTNVNRITSIAKNGQHLIRQFKLSRVIRQVNHLLIKLFLESPCGEMQARKSQGCQGVKST